MNVTIFIQCHNESNFLPHTVYHYKKCLPNCKIVIYDNMSTDGSKEVAESLGCEVIQFDTDNIADELYQTELRNNCWRNVKKGWVIVCDMDEWLCVDENDLYEEDRLGNTILNTVGYEIVGKSEKLDFSDIEIHDLQYGIRNPSFDKKICFNSEKIKSINYSVGAHSCNPVGVVKSSGNYLLKHMNFLGLPYFIHKNKIRHERNHKNMSMGLCIHYKKNHDQIKFYYNNALSSNHTNLKEICDECFFKKCENSFANIFVEYYHEENSIRRKEIIDSILKNSKLDFVKNIYLLTSKHDVDNIFNSQKFKKINISKRLTFQDVFNFANIVSSPDDINITLNNDIILTDSFESLKIDDDTFYCISRYSSYWSKQSPDQDSWAWRGFEKPCSGDCQDTWVWKGFNKIKEADFFYGILGCDNRLVFLAKKYYKEVLNPAYNYKTIHNHQSNIRKGSRDKSKKISENTMNLDPTVIS